MIMDFQQLLQQAKVKQKVVEKKHVEIKTKKEFEKRQKESRDIQKQKEAEEKLKRLKEAAVRRQLEYKGLHKPSKALPPPSTPQSSNSSSTKSSSKSKTFPTSAASDSKTTATKKPSESKPASSTKDTKSPATKKSKPLSKPVAAVNFNDLMKMAKGQKNGTSQIDQPPRRSSSPLGKSLLEKKAAKTKPIPPRPTPKGGKESTSYRVPASPTKRVTVDLTRHRCSPTSSQSKKVNGQAMKNGCAKNGQIQPPQNKATRDIATARSPLKSVPPRPSRTELASRKPPLKKQKTASARPTAFYGSAAANILGRRDGASMGGPFKYTSTWVDEMREELGDINDVDDLSDEDDMGDFVVESEDDFIDDGESEDYSSHIRKIFGYDKRRFTDDKFDDRIMESSFAQQQFEEERSARIGKLEDQEDILREQAEVSRKRKRKPSPIRNYGAPKSKLKQSKLPFF